MGTETIHISKLEILKSQNSLPFLGCGRRIPDFGIFGHSELVLSGPSSHQIILGILKERSQHREGFSFLSRDIDWEGIRVIRKNIDGLAVFVDHRTEDVVVHRRHKRKGRK